MSAVRYKITTVALSPALVQDWRAFRHLCDKALMECTGSAGATCPIDISVLHSFPAAEKAITSALNGAPSNSMAFFRAGPDRVPYIELQIPVDA